VGEVLRDPEVVDLVRVEPRDEDAAWRHFVARPERRLSYTDCTSFVVARRLGLEDVLTLDDDFRIEGFRVTPGRP
jgi:predicted nucleic acid-binding protein